MNTEAEAGEVQPQAEGQQRFPGTTRSWEKGLDTFSLRAARSNQLCQHLDFRLLTPTTVREHILASQATQAAVLGHATLET